MAGLFHKRIGVNLCHVRQCSHQGSHAMLKKWFKLHEDLLATICFFIPLPLFFFFHLKDTSKHHIVQVPVVLLFCLTSSPLLTSDVIMTTSLDDYTKRYQQMMAEMMANITCRIVLIVCDDHR